MERNQRTQPGSGCALTRARPPYMQRTIEPPVRYSAEVLATDAGARIAVSVEMGRFNVAPPTHAKAMIPSKTSVPSELHLRPQR